MNDFAFFQPNFNKFAAANEHPCGRNASVSQKKSLPPRRQREAFVRPKYLLVANLFIRLCCHYPRLTGAPEF